MNRKDLRKCTHKGSDAYFHTWEPYSDVIPPALTVGGHGGGQVSQYFALVEYEDGTMHRAHPTDIVFKIKEPTVVNYRIPFKLSEENFLNKVTEYNQKCPTCGCTEAKFVKDDGFYFFTCPNCKKENLNCYRTKNKTLEAFKKGEVKSSV